MSASRRSHNSLYCSQINRGLATTSSSQIALETAPSPCYPPVVDQSAAEIGNTHECCAACRLLAIVADMYVCVVVWLCGCVL